ncbi:MAG: hypothetical protein ACTHKV_04440 [Flavipsychrobacter sp.]
MQKRQDRDDIGTNFRVFPYKPHMIMDYSLTTNNIDDAEDLFLLAKDRLLDINDWRNNDAGFILTDHHKQKLHRNAHSGDFIKIGSSDKWLIINKIQYDDYPDVNGESLTIFLSYTDDPESMHTIAVNRVGKVLSVQGFNIDFFENAEAFLIGILATNEYAIAS